MNKLDGKWIQNADINIGTHLFAQLNLHQVTEMPLRKKKIQKSLYSSKTDYNILVDQKCYQIPEI